nr:4Fe-4S dicluster domain-containing protein [Reichenbachiella agariperforans]
MKITFRHFLKARTSRKPIGVADKDYFEHKEGIFTLKYPQEEFPVPDNGRYQLHNEIDDCIVCDKCAKVCPVNCIDIEPVRATEEIGKTSDGTSKKIYPAKFDIDMSKCCFCGLCTTVCPTECLTMTKEYDFSVFDLKAHNFEFSDMTADAVEEKKKELEIFNAEKEKAKAAAAAAKASTAKPAAAKPSFKPRVKPAATEGEATPEKKPAARPAFKPKVKKVDSESQEPNVDTESKEPKAKSQKPVFRPKIKKAGGESQEAADSETNSESKEPKAKSPKPVFRPKIKKKKTDDGESSTQSEE